ncbi:hypothetical protein BSKO_10923 [Bryopsis sp. KO-2023]|nr:hypothetical protein BSKO_10923 [Bryopsis sp. KO-2023]
MPSISQQEAAPSVSLTTARSGPPRAPLLRIGVVSDIQYCDIDDRLSFVGKLRYYRNTLTQISKAKDAWNAEGVDLVVHCGDIIDGTNKFNATSEQALAKVVDILDRIEAPVHHVLGNHCVLCMPRDRLRTMLKMGTESSEFGYYSVSPCASWRILMLDSSDVAIHGRAADHPHTLQAIEILNARNPNEKKEDPTGLEGTQRRFVSFGGGVGDGQLKWITSELRESMAMGQNVVICCHIPLIEGLYQPTCLAWNYQEVLAVLHEFPNVRLAMYGHTHNPSYLQDSKGIHHMVLPGLVETAPEQMAHGSLALFEDRVEMSGFGEKPRVMFLPNVADVK